MTARILDFLNHEIGQPVSLDTEIKSIGIDSLHLISISAEIDAKFNVIVSAEDLIEAKTIGHLVSKIAALIELSQES